MERLGVEKAGLEAENRGLEAENARLEAENARLGDVERAWRAREFLLKVLVDWGSEIGANVMAWRRSGPLCVPAEEEEGRAEDGGEHALAEGQEASCASVVVVGGMETRG